MGTPAWLGLPDSISQVKPETASALSPECPQFIFMRFAEKEKTEKTERTEDREGRGAVSTEPYPGAPGQGTALRGKHK